MTGREKYGFEIPLPIPASEIKEKVTTDIVVVGAGTGGAVAGAVAAMSGAKTILLNKDLVQAASPGISVWFCKLQVPDSGR